MLQQGRTADEQAPPFNLGDGSLAGNRLEGLRAWRYDIPFARRADDALGDRVLGVPLDGCGQPEDVIRRLPFGSRYIHNAELTTR